MDKQVASNHKLIIEIVSALIVLVVQHERSKQRDARSMSLFQRCVEKRQEPVPKLQILSNNIFIRLTKAPRFLIVTNKLLVVAAERSKETNLVGTNKQFSVTSSDEAAYITADKRFTGEPQGHVHRKAQSQSIPRAIRITNPHCRVALNSGVSSTLNHIGSLAGPHSLQSFVSSASH